MGRRPTAARSLSGARYRCRVVATIDPDAPEDAAPDGRCAAAPLIPYRTRRRRWLRRIAKIAATLFVTSTFLSVAYNAATDGRASVPAGLTYVQAGDVRTRYREWGTSG